MQVLLVVDEQPLYGLGFVQALGQGRARADVRTAPTLVQGLQIAAQWATLQVVLINHRLGGEDSLPGLRRFGTLHPQVARALLTVDADPALIGRARAAGAQAVLGRGMSAFALGVALDAVCRGEPCFPPTPAPAAAGPTPRQRQVLGLVASGRQNKQIAFELGIAERTVKLHVTALLQATGARNRTHLLVRARALGLLGPPELRPDGAPGG